MQLRYFLFVLLMTAAVGSQAQSYSYEDAIKKSDKALKSFLPKHLLPFTELYYAPYYYSEGASQDYFLLEKGKNTEGKLKMMLVRYHLKMHYSQCPAYDSIETVIEIQLDGKLKMTSHKGLEVVPDYALNNKPCNLITKKQAVAIAKKNGLEFYETDFQMDYDFMAKTFTYSVMGDLIPSEENPTVQVAESFMLDAATGEILENTFKKK